LQPAPVSSTQQRRFAAAFMFAHYLIWRYTVNVDNETETKIIERLDSIAAGVDKLADAIPKPVSRVDRAREGKKRRYMAYLLDF
jgi:hypothetical protein